MEKKEIVKFFIKVTLAHVLTYMACGLIGMTLFGYKDNMEANHG